MQLPTWARYLTRALPMGTLAAILLLGGASPALAARGGVPGGPGGGQSGGGTGGGKGGGGTTSTGNDVSYPQCGSSLPSSPAFAIIGVNGGVASDLNPCLGPSASYPSYTQSELYWAESSSTGTATPQPKASLYVNTADPGNVYNGTAISDWPTSSLSSDPYTGTVGCTTTTVQTTTGTKTVGENSPACAWQYGYNKATQDTTWLTGAARAIDGQESSVAVSTSPGAYPWWLDVETANTWQTGTTGLAMNVADLQGMVAGLTAAGISIKTVGVYSTSSQWDQITGGTDSGALAGLSDWIPGARNLSGAESNCSQTAFTGGTVTLTQWFGHPVDGDVAC